MRSKKNLFLSLFIILLSAPLYGQREKDSLVKVIETTSDSNTVNAMVTMARKYLLQDTAKDREMFNRAIDLSFKLNYRQGITVAWCNKANYILNAYGDGAGMGYLAGLLKYLDTLNPNRDYAKYLLNLGGMCTNTGKYDEAVNAYLKSLKISDALKHKAGSASAYHGLSYVNSKMHNFDKSEYYSLKALAIYTELGDEASCARMKANLGGDFFGKSLRTKAPADYAKAFDYLSDAAELCMKLGDIQTAATCYTNLGALFGSRQNYNRALTYCRKALQLKRQLGIKHGIVATMQTMCNIFAVQKNADSLKAYAFPTLEIAKEINATQAMTSAYNDISVYYELKNEPVKALEFYKRGKELEDSLQNADKLKSLADIESKYESEKKDKEISLLGELQKAKDEEIAKQRIINIIIAGGLMLVLVLSFFIFRQYAQKKKANALLETQNELIVEKNRNITDSINYAKVIQNAILPQENDFVSLFSSAFILFKPKDIVSGDFYWFTEKHGKKIVAAVDCTGHGVPGAFMSMIGITFLNEIINEKGITNPADVLGEMRNRVKASLKQRGMEGESRDGMDMALLCFDAELKTVEYAGANNSLWRVNSDSGFEEINPDKRPIGYYKGQGLPFTNHRLDLVKGDSLYIFTDGYADQFGGVKGKKFKYKQLKDTLLTISNLPGAEQKKILNDKIEEWRGALEQTDDICLMGIKI